MYVLKGTILKYTWGSPKEKYDAIHPRVHNVLPYLNK